MKTQRVCVIDLRRTLPVVCRIVADAVHRRNGYYSRAQDLLYQQLAGAEGTHAPVVITQMYRKMEWRVMAFLCKKTEHALCQLADVELRSREASFCPQRKRVPAQAWDFPTFLLLQALKSLRADSELVIS